MIRRSAFAAVVVAVAGLLTTGSADAQNKLVRLSYGSGWDALPAVVGIERGLFAREGLNVSGLPVSNAIAAAESVIGGTSDFALVPQRTLLVMAGAKSKFAIVSMNGWGIPMELVVPSSDRRTKKLAHLRGKRIAVGRGSEAFPALVRLLNREKMRTADVKIVELSARNLTKALAGGKADAVIEMKHLTSAIMRGGKSRIAMSNAQITKAIGRIGAAPVVANASFIEKYKDRTQLFVNGWIKALLYIKANPEDAATLMGIFFHRQGVKIDTKLARSWIKLVKYDRFTWSKADVADTEYNGWGLKTGGIIKVQPKLKGYIRNEFANNSMKQLKQAIQQSRAQSKK